MPLAFATAAAAQNLPLNPGIDGILDPWTVCGGDAGSLGSDRAGCADSRSLGAVADPIDCGLGFAGTQPYQLSIRQCVPLAGTGIVPGTSTVFFSGWLHIDRPEPIEAVEIRFFASAGCTGSEISSRLAGGSGDAGLWVLEMPPTSTAVPATAASIEYRVIAADLSATSSFFQVFSTTPTWGR